ncbi:hypothetical protein UT300012_24620 [Paraclostridium bifermentans]
MKKYLSGVRFSTLCILFMVVSQLLSHLIPPEYRLLRLGDAIIGVIISTILLFISLNNLRLESKEER